MNIIDEDIYKLDNCYLKNSEETYKELKELGFKDRLEKSWNIKNKYIKLVGKEMIQSDNPYWIEIPSRKMKEVILKNKKFKLKEEN